MFRIWIAQYWQGELIQGYLADGTWEELRSRQDSKFAQVFSAGDIANLLGDWFKRPEWVKRLVSITVEAVN